MNKFEKVSFAQYKESVGSDTDIRQEYEDIKLPQRATIDSAGYDFYSPCSFSLEVGETIKIPTGIRVRIDTPQTFLMIVPRSSLGFKYRLQLDNTVGVIDSGYFYSDNEGHIFAKLTNSSNENRKLEINKGDAFMQGIFVRFGITEDDNATAIRNGGCGSTDRG